MTSNSPDFLAGANAERARIASIVNHESSKGREALALHLALSGSFSLKEAIVALESAPRGQSKAQVEFDHGANEAKRLLGLA